MGYWLDPFDPFSGGGVDAFEWRNDVFTFNGSGADQWADIQGVTAFAKQGDTVLYRIDANVINAKGNATIVLTITDSDYRPATVTQVPAKGIYQGDSSNITIMGFQIQSSGLAYIRNPWSLQSGTQLTNRVRASGAYKAAT